MMNKNIIFHYVLLLIVLFPNCAKKTNKKLAHTYYKLGVLELNDNEQEQQACKKSLDYIEKAIEQDAKSEYLAFKATLLFKLGQEKEGDEYFQKALLANPEQRIRTEILNNQACLLAQSGMETNNSQKIQTAFKIWKKLEKDKDYLTPEVAYFNQAKVASLQENFKLAEEKLSETVKLAPNFLDAHYYLAQVACKLNDFKLAKNEIGTVLFLEPEHQGAKQLSIILQKK